MFLITSQSEDESVSTGVRLLSRKAVLTAVAANLPILGNSEKQSHATSVLLCLACLAQHNVSNADWRYLTRLKTVPLITHCMCVLIH